MIEIILLVVFVVSASCAAFVFGRKMLGFDKGKVDTSALHHSILLGEGAGQNVKAGGYHFHLKLDGVREMKTTMRWYEYYVLARLLQRMSYTGAILEGEDDDLIGAHPGKEITRGKDNTWVGVEGER